MHRKIIVKTYSYLLGYFFLEPLVPCQEKELKSRMG